ncbi:glycosyltransferase family 4 protein [Verticiella sediminum]|uniref:Glycosyltransferase family 4 protein n=1 Tax=Verticiella sediminum TaxID=1247510 RepID=A0A556A897_9BURK|nr:glycosyltransferase family 1 protein [Verticiella sediminum]TSH89108.1 glycosyltransferase family 4 protein [Verticiella sediminum]
MSAGLWIDVTASFNWRRAPSGITRVEQECCRWVLEHAPEAVRFCVYDTEAHVWHAMPHDEARAVLARRYSPLGEAIEQTVSAWRPGGAPIRFGPGERYLCLSADQTPERWAALYAAKRDQGLRVFGILYDLIPILFPHFYWKHIEQGTARYMTDLAWVAEHVVCISERTRRDALEFYRDIGMAAPAMSLVRLGDELPGASQVEPAPQVQALARERYILTVGTLEIRKNHETLYRALLDLRARGRHDLPLLVFAGMRGWRVDDLLTSLEQDPQVRGRIMILPHASDADIAHLYQHCLFTVFPSIYEGWGLPVAESLAYGKLCLASSAGSVPEIAPGLTEDIDPYDVRAWADRMLAYSRDEALLRAREARVAAEYRITRWRETAHRIMARALADAAPPPGQG